MRGAGADVQADPFGLFEESQSESVLPYSEEVYKAAFCR